MNSIKQSWWQLSTIQIGGAICLPVIMVGQTLAKNYGFFSAIIAIVLGNLLLFLLGVIALYMSLQKRISTIENARIYFGSYGTPILALTMIICLGGWFAIHLNVMSLSLQEVNKIVFGDYGTGTIGMILSNSILGALMTISVLKGIEALNRLSNWSMPLLIATIAYALYAHSSYIPQESSYSLGGISLVLATAIGVIADMPTYYRFARSNRDGIITGPTHRYP